MTNDEAYILWPARLVAMIERLGTYHGQLRLGDALPNRERDRRRPKNREFGGQIAWHIDKAEEVVTAVVTTAAHVIAAPWAPTDPTAITDAITKIRNRMQDTDADEVIALMPREVIKRLVDLCTELDRIFGRLLPAPDSELRCPKCGSYTGMLFVGETGDKQFRCVGGAIHGTRACDYQAYEDHYLAAMSAWQDAYENAVLITVKVAAAHFGIPQATIHSWLRRGKLTRHQKGRRVLIDISEIKTLIGAEHAPPFG